MPGESRWSVLKVFAESWEPASASGSLWDTGQGYPAAIFADGDEYIPGFVVTICENLWPKAVRRLDQVEGEGVLYRRVELTTSKGKAISYEWIRSTSDLRRIRDGWAKRESEE